MGDNIKMHIMEVDICIWTGFNEILHKNFKN
jgi:hypothetical protein